MSSPNASEDTDQPNTAGERRNTGGSDVAEVPNTLVKRRSTGASVKFSPSATSNGAINDSPTSSNAKLRNGTHASRDSHSSRRGSFANWGRAWEVDWFTFFGCLFILFCCPLFPGFFVLSCQKDCCSLVETLMSGSTPSSLIDMMTSSTWHAAGIYATWVAFQVILAILPDFLHYILPVYKGGITDGAVTPAGIVNKYNINGLQAWVISNFLWFGNAFYWNLFSPSIISRNLPAFLLVTNCFGYFMSFFSFVKAHVFPTNAEDSKFSGSMIYDFLMGIEFNPRIWDLDFKLFFNGRPGIVCWTIINFSFAWHQYEKYGYVSDSMFLVNILHAIYVLDFFWNEGWYLKTIDICHEHFGFYLAWGDTVWLPFMYTLQAQYLVHHPAPLGFPYFSLVLFLGLVGYYIFRSANCQKDQFRANPSETYIWGQKATYVECSYTSSDGKIHQSTLLTSGWWGVTRHMNYTGDLLGSLAYCLACGNDGYIFPYFYIIYMTILLLHRIYRDEHRCLAKYGEDWKKYTSIVPYRLIPRIY